MLGAPDLPLIAIPHPLAGNSRELVHAKAFAIANEVAHALTASPALLAARYAGRFLNLTESRLAGGAVCIDTHCALDPALTSSRAP